MADENLIVDVDYSTAGGQADDFFDGKPIEDSPDAPDTRPGNDNPAEGKSETPEQPPAPTDGAEAPKEDGEPKPEEKSGIYSQFFSKDPQGNMVLDAKGALDFLGAGDSGKTAFSPVQPPSLQQKEPTDGGKPAEPTNPYLARIEARRAQQKNLSAGVNTGIEKYIEARKAGYDETQAIMYSRQQLQSTVDEQLAEWEYKYDTDQASQQEQQLAAKPGPAMEAQSKANVAAYVSQLGDKSKFDQFFFGSKNAQGQYESGMASDAVWKLFSVMNPTSANPTQEQYNEWWTRVSSDRGMMDLLYQFGIARLQRQLMPQILEQAGNQTAKTKQGQQKAGKRAPSNLQGGTPASADPVDAEIDNWLNPVSAPGGARNTV